ncbi:MAG: hypothetical protein CVU38_17850 [Chloroflexi bacterium HGW-Chloroflexi-1]|nr:MAG: hypothetical protein CVU38_17850 [Chloroflexi bacterium HGW-Chloroflexi-1]
MNVFNRILTVLLLIVLLALAVLLAVFPAETVSVAGRGLQNSTAWLSILETSYYLFYVIGRIALVIVALLVFGLLLWGELRPRRPKAVRVHTDAGSQATVTTDSVSLRLAWHVDQLADVISVTPRVTAHGQSVDVLLDVETSPEIDVPMKTDEVVAVTREIIQDRMGMQLGKVEVRIKHAPYAGEA